MPPFLSDMPTRPPFSPHTTATTFLSITSSSDNTYNSTALTSPSLCSPRKGQLGKLEPMLEVFEAGARGTVTATLLEERSKSPAGIRPEEMPRRISMDLSRGPSVKDRANRFEQSATTASASTASSSRTRSTSPLRINKSSMVSTSVTPNRTKRVPVPTTAPVQRTARLYEEPDQSMISNGNTKTTPPELKRGKGSARRMIQAWETGSTPRSLPSIPVGTPMTTRVLSREYLDQKPLPIPRATPLPASSAYSPAQYRSSPYNPSPLQQRHQQHLQTPQAGPSRKRSSTLSPSTSAYSLSPSPSGEKRRRGKSPLKDILNVFGGGIQALGRKAKGKGRSMQKSASRDSFGMRNEPFWSEGMERVGSSGLPGGIVFSDRMGDQEMDTSETLAAGAVRSSAMMYLIPTPCSSLAPWGSWLTSWGILDSQALKITYCPVFQNPQSGHSTPRRVLSGTYNASSSTLAVPFNTIPPPEPGMTPDVELSMQDCVEVRSLRKEEVRGRGIPPVPEGVGTEVLEMVWSDGNKRYIGVEGVGGRLGWVSAIWDILLACKSEQPQALPPPSPAFPPGPVPQMEDAASSVASLPFPDQRRPAGELSTFQHRIAHIEARAAGSTAPPVQKVGDTWVAASVLGGNNSDVGQASGDGADLRNSVQRMFEAGPDVQDDSHMFEPVRRGSDAIERIKAWQPKTEHDLSIFSRHHSRRSAASAEPIGGDTASHFDNPTTDTILSFDPNDLNPSRSASQVRRASSVQVNDDPAARYRPTTHSGYMPVLDERSDDGMTEALRAPTHISHVTFPKPTVGGARITASQEPTLPTIASASNSSCETGESTTMQTPRTGQTAPSTAATSIMDQTVIAKLDTHSNEHGELAKQVDGVQLDLARAITALGALVSQSRTMSDPTKMPIPSALDDKLTSIALDVKGVENALQLSNLASSRHAHQEESQLPEIHSKLDAIAKLCEEVLAKHNAGEIAGLPEQEIDGLPIRASRVAAPEHPATPSQAKSPAIKKEGLSLIVENDEVKQAGQEVAQIMAELTGGSTKASPRLGGIQVLHNASAPNSPKPSSLKPASDEVTKQVGEVLSLVKELKDARSIQTQQTTDMARYLNELNTWLEKFVQNSTTELNAMNTRLTTLVGEVATEERPAVPGLPDLVADVHSMMSDQKRRNEAEGMVGQRLDGLLTMMGEERERMAGQQSTVEHVLQILEKQRQDNEVLLRAVATDLTAEIRGERIRFVEAMQQATTVNVNLHVEEFKKILGTEVGKAMSELGRMREEKRALEQQISDLFALKAKHAVVESRKSTRRQAGPTAGTAGPPSAPGSAIGTPGQMTRGLPAPPR